MQLKLILLFLMISPSWAKVETKIPFKYVTYEIHKQFYKFISNIEQRIIISESCGMPDNPTDQKCQAIDALNNVKSKVTKFEKSDVQGGKSTGDVLCKKYLGGRIAFGLTQFKNPISFCVFEDGSMVSAGSIAYHWRKND